jgi:hypothetical protein
MTPEELRAHTIRINDATYAAWNAHDADAVAAIFAPCSWSTAFVIPTDGAALAAQLGLA